MSAEATVLPPSPASIGRFEVIGRLGQGAQSVVYLAYDPQLHREVALKTVHLEHNDARRAALLREARAVSRLSHPAIVPVFEAQETADGSCLVFEYVAGRTLAERLADEGALPVAEAVALMLPVLDAVAYAHANRIVHRDLKPSNILLDHAGRPRVMDFGIAVRHDSPAGLDDDDRMAAMLGTPAYMAPEYAGAGLVSPAMDVFAAGLVLYEMLCGRRAVGEHEGVRAIRYLLNHDVRLPEHGPEALDEALRAIVNKALARDPAARHATMDELAQSLRRWQDPVEPLPSAHDEMAESAAMDALLARMPADLVFPCAQASLQALRALPSEPAAAALADIVVGDPALLLRLLRDANALEARLAGQMPVASVTAAILALGEAAVRQSLLGTPAWSAQDGTGSLLAGQYAAALFSGHLAREIAGLSEQDGEEAFVCGVAQQLGRLLLARCFPMEAQAVLLAPVASRWRQEAMARELLGTGLEALAATVGRSWGLPELVLRCMWAVRPGEALVMPATRAELLRAAASLAGELGATLGMPDDAAQERALSAALRRFGPCLCLSAHEAGLAMSAAAASLAPLLPAWFGDMAAAGETGIWARRVLQLSRS